MKGSILGSRALRVACACALALGIAPAAAWGVADGEQPASDVKALQEVVEDISQAGDEVTPPEDDELTSSNDADSEPASKQAPAEESTKSEDAGKNASGDESLKSDSEHSSFELQAQSLGSQTDDESQTEKQTTTQGDVTLNLETTSINAHVYQCAFSDTVHPEKGWGVPYSLTIPEGADKDDYQILCDDLNVFVSVNPDEESGNSLSVFTTIEGSYTATIKVVSYDDSGNETIHDSVSVTITTTIDTTPLSFTANENCTVSTEMTSYFVYDASGYWNDESIFAINEAGISCALGHGPEDFIRSVQSSDPSVLSVNTDDQGATVLINNPGTSLITLTLTDGREFTNLVTVEDFEDKIKRELKFTEDEINMSFFEPMSGNEFASKFVSTGNLPDYESDFAIESSDGEVLRYESNTDGPSNLVVLKPGTVTLTLYYPIWTDDGPLVTDTMTVNVILDQTPLATAAPESNVTAGLIASNNVTNSLVGDNDLSLKAVVGNVDDLTADQLQRLETIANGEHPIIVPIDLSLVDQSGAVFDDFDSHEDYKFLVKLKIEDDLAEADLRDLSVVYLGADELEPVNSWVEDDYLYILTSHFSPYAIVGQAGSSDNPTTPDDNGSQTGDTGNGSQGGNPGTGNGQGGSTTTVTDKGGASNTSTAKNDAAKTSGASHSDTPLAQTGDELMPLAVALGFAAILTVGGLIFARRRTSR